jgi:cytochrome P450
MSNYFSMTNIRSYEPMVLNRVSRLCNRMKECKKRSEPINFTNAYRCLSVDTVSSFALPEPRNMLDSPDLGKAFARVIRNFSRLITYQRHLKIVFPLLTSIPDWVMLRMDTDGSGRELVETQLGYEKAAKVAIHREGIPPDGQAPSILDAIVSSPEIGRQDKLHGRIVEEARNTVGAGTETTAATLTVLTYHVLANLGILAKLKAELQGASDENDQLNMKILEKLPYLQACINEALRICVPVTGRLPRSNPRAATTYTTPTGKMYTFPPGTVMSMSMPDLHFNPDIFPDPDLFKPERWLESSPEVKAKMQQFFVPFGKGSRSCIGMELAKMEVVLAAGNIFRDFDLELFETTERDVSWAHDFFAPAIPFDSQGLRVMVK